MKNNMKNLVCLIVFLTTAVSYADTVEFKKAEDGSAEMKIGGDEAKKLFLTMENVTHQKEFSSVYAGFGTITIAPFPGVQCVEHYADRRPPSYSCSIKFQDVKNGVPVAK